MKTTKYARLTESRQHISLTKRRLGFLLLVTALLLAACSQEVSPPEPPADLTEVSSDLVVSELPQPGTLSSPVEGYANYGGEPYGCDHTLESGPQRFKEYLIRHNIAAFTYPTDGCRESFHEVGRALDIQIANDPHGGPEKQAFADWLTANNGEMAKRLGIVQIIWNLQIWRSYNGPQGAWEDHIDPEETTDPGERHTNHVHLSFGLAGANGETSFFTDVIDGPAPAPPGDEDEDVADYRAEVTVSSGSRLNVRSGPGTNYSRIGSLARGRKVTVTHHNGIWRAIEFGGGKGYVHSDYLRSVEPSSSDWPTLSRGSSNHSAVRVLQYLLKASGATQIVVDGNFGPQTENIVKFFQGSDATGIVDEAFWRSLVSDFTLRQGDRGWAVRALQQRMTDIGYSLTVDGIFGPATHSKVVAFQEDAGITVDGLVGPETWQALLD